jgi:hypothetical protein
MPKSTLLAAVLLAGCVTVSKSVLMDRSDMPVPQRDVQVLLPGDTIPASCERVALLHASGDVEVTDEGDMWDELRKVAGELGANVVHLHSMEDPGVGERFATEIFGGTADRDADAVALWCPEGIR